MLRVTALALAILAGGCAADPLAPGPSMQSECRHGSADPITAEQAVSTLRGHGFSVYREEQSLFCGGDYASEDVIANVLESGPHANFSDPGDIAEREGALLCNLFAKPFPNADLRVDTDAPSASPIFSGRKAVFSLANLECTLYPEGDETEAHIARLHDAFFELERRVEAG